MAPIYLQTYEFSSIHTIRRGCDHFGSSGLRRRFQLFVGEQNDSCEIGISSSIFFFIFFG